MLRHIVFFSASDPGDLDRIAAGLALLGTIPEVRHFEVQRNQKVDQVGNDVDLVVYAEFDDMASLAAYKAHPTYAEATRQVRPLRSMRMAADFEATGAGAVPLRRSA